MAERSIQESQNQPLQSSCRNCCTLWHRELDNDGHTFKEDRWHIYKAPMDCTQCFMRQHLTNRQLYGNLPTVSSVIQVRRLQFAGHCYRNKNEVVSRVILWEPKRGRRSQGRPAKSYINILAANTGAESSELPGLMGNRERWKTIVDSARARSTE